MSITFTCDRCGQRYQVGEAMAGRQVACKHCGEALTIPASPPPAADFVDVDVDENEDDAGPAAGPYQPPRADPRRSPGPGASGGDETVSTIIPYKNAAALTSYYLGLFSCFPVLGLPMAVVALVLGVKGLKAVREDPKAHGTAHAWVGLVCGTIGLLINLLITGALVIGLVAAAAGK